MKEGTIFNIQQFCTDDGPGIRTTVFFKGCPLRCRWCANPESQAFHPEILWDKDRCTHCKTCTSRCEHEALAFENETLRVFPLSCRGCGHCVAACPHHALSRIGNRMMAEEILDVCRKDRDFYEESGGGVTLSGGEPLAQPDFAIGLLAQLREEGIHTAMETSGYASPKVFQQVLHHVDAFLFDCKHHNLDAHQKGTGVPNGIILKNLYEAIGTGKEVVVRIPLIPGYNDAISDAEGFCSLLWPMGVRAVQLLPFHQFGEKKYDQMGVPYAFSGISSLPREDLLPFRKIFLDRGMKCIL